MQLIELQDPTGEDYDCPKLKHLDGAIYVITDYYDGGYDGCGHAFVVYKDWSFLHHDMSHCSCYSPWSKIKWDSERFLNVDSFLAKCSGELQTELKPIIKQYKKLRGDV